MNQADSMFLSKAIAGAIIFLALWFLVMWIAAIIDVIRSEFTNPSNKTTWILLLLFLAPFATILYQIIGKDQRKQRDTSTMQRKPQPDRAGSWRI